MSDRFDDDLNHEETAAPTRPQSRSRQAAPHRAARGLSPASQSRSLPSRRRLTPPRRQWSDRFMESSFSRGFLDESVEILRRVDAEAVDRLAVALAVEAGGLLVGDEIKISIDLELVKQLEQPAVVPGQVGHKPAAVLRHIRIIAQFDPQLGQRPGIADGNALARLFDGAALSVAAGNGVDRRHPPALRAPRAEWRVRDDALVRVDHPVVVQRVGDAPDSMELIERGAFELIDVAGNTFAEEIAWLAGAGVTTGYDNPTGGVSFRPSDAVLREQMAAFLYRFDRLDR